MMENGVIKDTSLEKISASDSKVRFTAKVVKKDDKTGTFEVSDKGKSIICLPPPTGSFDINEGDLAAIIRRSQVND